MFDKEYYDSIWLNQGIHRHDYCESLADYLINKYGKCRYLDIGTGCGFLVKILREKGCDAWGLEISDFAIANTCAPGFVVKGSVTDIPFKDKRFDVVCSNGLWEYLTEEEIDVAVKEVWRVGDKQEHNIDHDQTIWQPEYQYVTWKSLEWWKKKLERPNKVLVTCPTYDGKEYCWQKWIDTVKSLTYPNYDIFVVDNSKTEEFYDRYKNQIPMVHLDFTGQKDNGMYRVCKSMGRIREHFLNGNYTHWMNIEADNIPPEDIIETLFRYGGGDADWVSHGYPTSPGSKTIMQGIGCSLLSRKLMADFDWSDDSIADDSPDSELWNWVKNQPGGYKTCELWYIADVLHLK